MTKLINIHRKSDKVPYGDSCLIISSTACWNANSAVINIVENLSHVGNLEEYIDQLEKLGCKNPEKVLRELCDKKILKEQIPFKKRIWSFIKEPRIRLIKGSWINYFLSKNLLNIIFSPFLIVLTISIYLMLLIYSSIYNYHPVWNSLTILWILLGVLFHEVGHSIACGYVGIGYRPIGLSWYLLWPIAFTNVSGIELLNKKQKILINMSGIYLQILAMIFLFIAGLVLPKSGCGAAIQVLNYLILFNINPFINSDGFWCIQDVMSKERNTKNRLFNIVYQIGFGLFTAYLAYRVGKSTIHFVARQYHSWLGLNMVTVGQVLSSIVLLYLQFLIVKGIGGRIIKYYRENISPSV